MAPGLESGEPAIKGVAVVAVGGQENDASSDCESSDVEPQSPRKEGSCSAISMVVLMIKSCFVDIEKDIGPRKAEKSKSKKKKRRVPAKLPNTAEEVFIRIKLGWDGKETKFLARNLNIVRTFGNFAILLDSHNHMVPLTKEGYPIEPLDPECRYMVLLNTIGSSKKKWDQIKKAKKREKEFRKKAELQAGRDPKEKKKDKGKDKNKSKSKIKLFSQNFEAAAPSESSSDSLLQTTSGSVIVMESFASLSSTNDTYDRYSVFPEAAQTSGRIS